MIENDITEGVKNNNETFDVNVGKIIKDFISGLSYDESAKKVNCELKEILTKEEYERLSKCSATKMSRYARGKSALPIIYLAGICQFAEKSADDFYEKVFKEFDHKWKGNKERRFKLPSDYTSAIFNYKEVDKRDLALIKCIDNKEIDSAFAYSGYNVTRKYIKLMHSSDYSVYADTKTLLEENKEDILKILQESDKRIRIICLGIGDGSKDATIIKKLYQEKMDLDLEYWVFDNSSDMISIGLNNLEKELEDNYKKLEIKLFQMDFMHISDVLNNSFVDTSNRQNLFLLLGNTLGNFPEDILLDRINAVMQPGDYLLVDNQLKKPGRLTPEDENELKRSYDTEDVKAYIHAILEAADIKESDGIIKPETSYEYGVKSEILENDNCMTIKLNFIINKLKRVNIGNTSTTIPQGEKF